MAAKATCSTHGQPTPSARERASAVERYHRLLTHALKSGMVDAVLAVKKGQDIYDAVPTPSPTPQRSADGRIPPLCTPLLLSKLVKISTAPRI